MSSDRDESSKHQRRSPWLGALVIGIPLGIGIGIFVRVRGRRLVRALHRAVMDVDIKEIDRLLAAGADIEGKNREGLTPRMYAIQMGFLDVAKHLEEKGADNTKPIPTAEKIADTMMDYKEKEVKNSALVVLVAKGGDILYERAVGYADSKKKVKADVSTKFIIGSITKQFVSSAILKLQEGGKLSITDNLAKYYPEFNRGKLGDITLHHLLTHTSGIRTYTGLKFTTRLSSELIDSDALIAELAEFNLDFDPGETYEYSNSNYLLLGRIVEKVNRKALSETLKSFFFDPLGMKDTTLFPIDENDASVAKDSIFPGGTARKRPPLHWSWSANGAGGLRSSARDLMRWNEAVFSGKVLSKSSLDAAFSPPKLGDGSDSEYGYGWVKEESRGLSYIFHSGGMNGFTAQLFRCVEERLTIVVLSNGKSRPYVALNVLYLSFLWNKWDSLEPIEVDRTEDSGALALLFDGRYDLGPEMRQATILWQGDNFKLSGPVLGQHVFLPVDAGKALVCRASISRMRIEPTSTDDQGRAVEVVITCNNRSKVYRGKRVEEPVKPRRSEMRHYAGRYDGGFEVKFRRGRLFVTIDSRCRLFESPIEPVSASEFYIVFVPKNTLTFCDFNDSTKRSYVIVKEGNNEFIAYRL